jgi:hypothetical protein
VAAAQLREGVRGVLVIVRDVGVHGAHDAQQLGHEVALHCALQELTLHLYITTQSARFSNKSATNQQQITLHTTETHRPPAHHHESSKQISHKSPPNHHQITIKIPPNPHQIILYVTETQLPPAHHHEISHKLATNQQQITM